MAKSSKTRTRTRYHRFNFDWLEGSLENLPFQDNALRMASAINLFAHYDAETQRKASEHIARKLTEGGVFLEGSAESSSGGIVIWAKERGRMIPREVLFLDRNWLSFEWDKTHPTLHRSVRIPAEQRRILKRILARSSKPSDGSLGALVDALNDAGFLAALTQDGQAFTMALNPDSSPARRASSSRATAQNPQPAPQIPEAA